MAKTNSDRIIMMKFHSTAVIFLLTKTLLWRYTITRKMIWFSIRQPLNLLAENLTKLMYAMVEYNGNMQSYDLEHHEYDENYEEKRTGNTDENPAGGNN